MALLLQSVFFIALLTRAQTLSPSFPDVAFPQQPQEEKGCRQYLSMPTNKAHSSSRLPYPGMPLVPFEHVYQPDIQETLSLIW